MRPRDVLAANLNALMAARPDLSRLQDITAASDGKLTNGTLDRVRRAEVALTLDKLADLAEVFDVQPWQLLVEGFDPHAIPQLADARFLLQIRELVASVPLEVHQSEAANQKQLAAVRPSEKQLIHDKPAPALYSHIREEERAEHDEHAVPAKKRHAAKKNHGPTRRSGGSRT